MSNAELNEKDLEGVSGGISVLLIDRAQHICRDCQCNPHGERVCNVSIEQLAEYMEKQHRISTWRDCPFWPRG